MRNRRLCCCSVALCQELSASTNQLQHGSIYAHKSIAYQDRPPQTPGDCGLRSPQKRRRSQERQRRQRVRPRLLDKGGHCFECRVLRPKCALIRRQAIRACGWHVRVTGHMANSSYFHHSKAASHWK